MVTKPILFNTDMVRAIMDDRKTTTRRVMKPQPLFYTGRKYIFADDVCPKKWVDCDNIIDTYKYQPGDYLYVRETWKQAMIDPDGGGHTIRTYLYKADEPIDIEGMLVEGRWHPSIHMPKGAARIFLHVKDVRVERLQEVTMNGMLAEGVIPENVTGGQWQQWQHDYMIPVWDSTIKSKDRGKYGWHANPWVWVIEFEKA